MEAEETPTVGEFKNKDDCVARVDWMRAAGVLSAQFSESGALICCTLGAKPEQPRPQHKLTPEEIRAERMRVALAAGSQLTRRPEMP